MSILHIDMAQVIEILPCERPTLWKTYLFHIDSIMVADDLATQGARASSAMILT